MDASKPPSEQTAYWPLDDHCLMLTWQEPAQLLGIDIGPAADAMPGTTPPPALLCQACDVLLEKLGLDDPLLAALLPLRMALRETLAGTVTMTDRRPLLQDGKVAILRTPLTT